MEIKTPDQVRAEFKAAGITFGQWARENGYRPAQVYRVTSGVDKGYYGDAHEIAVKLGLKAKGGDEETAKPIPAGRTIELAVRHTRCRHGKPLVIVQGVAIGDGAELRPEVLRAYGRLLLDAADDADLRLPDSPSECALYVYHVDAAHAVADSEHQGG